MEEYATKSNFIDFKNSIKQISSQYNEVSTVGLNLKADFGRKIRPVNFIKHKIIVL
jgi:hypothetical protein